MATLTATAAQATVSAKYNINGDITRVVQYGFTAAQSVGDVVQMMKVPRGAIISNLQLWTDEFGGGNITFTVGDGNAAARYLGSASSSASIAVALSLLRSAVGYTYTADDTIDVAVTTTTSATAVGVIKMRVTYTLDN